MHLLATCLRLLPRAKGQPPLCRFGWRHGSSGPVPLAYFKVTSDSVDFNKTPLLIFHGLFGLKANWRSISNQLANTTQRAVYSIDLRNHGDSPHVDGELSDIATMASDIDLFLERTYLSQAILLGHSLGGRIACQFAFQSPDKCEKLILADVSPLANLPPIDFLTENLFDYCKLIAQELPPGLEMSQARSRIGKLLMSRIQNKFIVDFFLMSLYKDTDGAIKWKFNTDALKVFVTKRMIDKVQTDKVYPGPTLIIHGEQSDYVKKEDYDSIRKLLPAVQFAPIANAGHYLHVQKTAEFIEHVVKFLED